MSPANSTALSGLLSDRGPLGTSAAVDVWRQLLDQVAALHKSGHLHGKITLQSVFLSSSGKAHLAPSPNRVVLEDSEPFELCPPELEAHAATELPAEIAAVSDRLAAMGANCDPRRIDIYQLGALLGRMLTGEGVHAYLQSPKIRGKVPMALREIVDRSLGFEANRRFNQICQLQAALTPVNVSSSASQPEVGTLNSNAPPFDRLGPYKILSRIGGGGMGEVYRAHDQSLDRDVAIKVLPAELARHEDFVRRFRAEAMAVAKLVHPNIVQIYTFSEDSGHRYFAMQYVEGESLADCLKRRLLSVEETLLIVEQCLAGLAAAHAKGLIHRDVKPGNILLDHVHRRALLADFGLVKALHDGASLTTTGEVLGTLDYLSPEQAHGQAVDGRADLYSLGVVMFQMLCGRLPFEAETPTTMIFKHAFEQPPALADLAPDVPRRIDAIVTRLMAKNPNNRYQTADEVLDDIRAFRVGKPATKKAKASSSGANDTQFVPDFAAECPALLAAELEPRGVNWQRWIPKLFSRPAEQLAEKLQNTQQQVDGAVRQYQQRHNELAALVRDAEDVARELSAQAAGHQEAAREAAQKSAAASDPATADQYRSQQADYERAAADFEKQLAEQRARNQELHSQLSQVAGTLQQLRSRRDVLNARLDTAMAEIHVEGGGRSRSRMPAWIVVAAAVVLGVAGLGALGSALFGRRAAVPVAVTTPRTSASDQSPFAIRNASDPRRLPDPNEDKAPFAANLSGQWQLHLPAGFDWPVELTRLDADHYRFKSKVSMSGVYWVRGDHLVMVRANEVRKDEFWEYRWQIMDDQHLVLIGQPQIEKIGSDYVGATLQRQSP